MSESSRATSLSKHSVTERARPFSIQNVIRATSPPQQLVAPAHYSAASSRRGYKAISEISYIKPVTGTPYAGLEQAERMVHATRTEARALSTKSRTAMWEIYRGPKVDAASTRIGVEDRAANP